MEKTAEEAIADFFARIPKCNLSEEELEEARKQMLLDDIEFMSNRDEKGYAIWTENL